MSKTEPIIFQVNEKLKRDFKAKVAKDGTNMSEKLNEWIKKYVSK